MTRKRKKQLPEHLNPTVVKDDLGDVQFKVTSRRKGGAEIVGPQNVSKFTLDNGLTITEEAYARARAYGMSQHEAVQFATDGRVTAASAGANWEANNPALKQRINDLCVEVSDRVIEAAGLSKSWVIKRLMQVAERCMQAEPVLIRNSNGDWVPSGEYKFDSAGANRALELLGKEMAMFSTKIDVTRREIHEIPKDSLTDLAKALAAEVGLTLDGSNLISAK